MFCKSEESKLCDVGTDIYRTVTCKEPGLSVHHSNMVIVAMRGRNPEHPTERTKGIPTEQRLEPNLDGICNTLTTVQKDNLVMEKNTILKDIEKYGNEKANYKPFDKAISYPLTSQDFIRTGFMDIAPTMAARDYKDPKVITEKVKIKQATKEGYAEMNVGGVCDLSFPESETRRGRVQEEGDVCPTLTTQNNEICRIETKYRIRKLTPKECWRLMGFSDEDFEKAASVNSNTQLYKQAGNSIVVKCLEGIFQNLIGDENGN